MFIPVLWYSTLLHDIKINTPALILFYFFIMLVRLLGFKYIEFNNIMLVLFTYININHLLLSILIFL